MRKFPVPKPKLPYWAGPDDDGSADCPDCEENEDGGPCAVHGDWPSLLGDPDKLAEES